MGKHFSRFDPTPSRSSGGVRAPLHAGPRAHGPGAAAPDAVAAQLPHGSRGRAGGHQRRFQPAAAGVALRGAALRAGRVAGLQSRAERDGRAGSRQLPVPAAFLRGRGDRAVGPPRRPDGAGEVHARGRPAGVGRSRAGLELLHRARGPGARGDGRRVRRSRAVPQPRAQRDRVRAARRGGPAAGRHPRARPRAWATSRRTSTIAAGARRRSASSRATARWAACRDLVDVNLLRVEEETALEARLAASS